MEGGELGADGESGGAAGGFHFRSGRPVTCEEVSGHAAAEGFAAIAPVFADELAGGFREDDGAGCAVEVFEAEC